MTFDFDESKPPKDVAGLWTILVRFVRSLIKSEVVLSGVKLQAGRNPINIVQRGRGAPSFAAPVVRGDTPVATSVDSMTASLMVIHSASICTVDILLKF